MTRPHIKICGLKTEGHIDTVLARGCSEVGFVHFERSPRHLSIEDMIRLRAHVGGRALVTVVTVDADDEFLKRLATRVRPDVIQLHGSETAARVAAVQALTGATVMKAIPVTSMADLEEIERFRPVADRILLDARAPKTSNIPGGNGVSFDWGLLDALESRDFTLSGGINPDTIEAAVRRVAPRGLDVSSGVEREPGVKDDGLIHRLFDAFEAAVEAGPLPLHEEKRRFA
ncbi:phosphoribosylanthranilate isomerase [Aureimonas phyllosphaerae]|uniref:N-(5'-phosphoribosyl)anthranilate isomerase n=1 Tax=Aureimonas phyllosphaerae TaxID=1166078 RepID=A0A7W6BWN7_9HYPH|nr:phosphoribosylanthranilate isomerase [Aureimonas phyllosphaerae]MBB3937419.1 phosphoribosylanthranilate isomerase [Aureimonas phyllosphaerae]MBB3961515.1 phosphoribosylanthranilate isomerase [Aureimonas phyllosphaerae]SFF38930.1 phosphoribosylanthranilate isomerase [Aureimonas phyllosphaerae]